MISLDPLLTTLFQESSGTPGNQIDVANQREAWLRQMELQQIALMQQDTHPSASSMHEGKTGDADRQPPAGKQPAESFSASQRRGEAQAAILLPVHTLQPDASTTTAWANDPVHLPLQRTTDITAGTPLPKTNPPLARLHNSSTPAVDPHQTETAHPRDATSAVNWQKRVVHIARQGQQISLSIRDATLEPWQARQIVYRISGEASRNGLKLQSAIINGKPTTSPDSPSVSSITEQERQLGT